MKPVICDKDYDQPVIINFSFYGTKRMIHWTIYGSEYGSLESCTFMVLKKNQPGIKLCWSRQSINDLYGRQIRETSNKNMTATMKRSTQAATKVSKTAFAYSIFFASVSSTIDSLHQFFCYLFCGIGCHYRFVFPWEHWRNYLREKESTIM